MKQHNPSIFNDVLGPTMRGPSSSHTAASWRIAKVSLDLLDEELSEALVEFDKNGAWASNYEPQGTVLGMSGGLLDIDLQDEQILDYKRIAHGRNAGIQYQVTSFPADHPNTVRLTLRGKKGKELQVIAVSTGGGMMEIRSVNHIPVRIAGDYYELLIFYSNILSEAEKKITEEAIPLKSSAIWIEQDHVQALNVKSNLPFEKSDIQRIKQINTSSCFAEINPVLPVLSGSEGLYPFDSLHSMLEYGKKNKLDLGQLGIDYEQARSGLDGKKLKEMMQDLISTVDRAITNGLKGTSYDDRILQQQSHLLYFREKESNYFDPLVNRIISYVSALMEYKSAFGVIVAIPTAGSCGTVGGLIKAVAEKLEVSTDDLVKAFFAAGMIGVFFSKGPGFSAEEHGCQVETGAAGCMAAGALVQLYGGDAQQAVNAASMALQNSIGLICDPVANRVEVPCLGKNVTAAMNGLAAATMALSGFDAVIPLNETIDSVSEAGKKLHPDFCCTGHGGLAATSTSEKILKKLENIKNGKN